MDYFNYFLFVLFDATTLLIAICTLFYFILVQSIRVVDRLSGRKFVVTMAAIGTPIHELSHFVMCHIFQHRVHRVEFFINDPKSKTLGYVSHSYNRTNIYQLIGCFFIGMAPLIGGAISIHFLTLTMLGDSAAFYLDTLIAELSRSTGLFTLLSNTIASSPEFFQVVFYELIESPFPTLVWFYLSGSIAFNMFPSPADFKGAWFGGLVFYFFLAGIMFVTNESIEITSTIKYASASILGYFVFAALLCGMFAIISIIISICGNSLINAFRKML